MKKTLIFCLVISMTASAFAVPYFRVDPAWVKDHYMPSEIVTIQLVDDNPVLGFSIDAITDGGVGGIALEPLLYNSGFEPEQPIFPPELNYDGKLIAYLAVGYRGPAASGILFSFEYHIPYTPPSTFYGIETFADGDEYWLPEILYADGSSYVGHIPGPVFHIPEPATLALLALGALMLKRRK
ncbi:MAG: PEP-CTERM sorting domain-containing protein [Sedimentisphaerales bacterium]|nr:PEP-CTERM sorting domain-containing protein [Sedimentisphaerales bacterium]